MIRQMKLTPLLLALVITGRAAATATPQVLVDDFESGTDDAWTHDLAGNGESWGPGVFDASSGAYHPTTTGLVPSQGLGVLSSYWNASAAPSFNDGFWRATVRAEPGGTNVAFVLRGGVGFSGGYLVTTTIDGQLDIYDCKGIDCTILGESIHDGGSPEFMQGEDWILEAGAVGDMITAKIWRKGDPEPAQPNVTVQDSTYPTGLFGVAAFVGTAWTQPEHTDAFFDDIQFTPAGVLEPRASILAMVVCFAATVLRFGGFDRRLRTVTT